MPAVDLATYAASWSSAETPASLAFRVSISPPCLLLLPVLLACFLSSCCRLFSASWDGPVCSPFLAFRIVFLSFFSNRRPPVLGNVWRS